MMPQTEPKKRFPRAAAIQVAREMVDALKPHCHRIIVAGSLRRQKSEVGDVEILYIPKTVKTKVDLLMSAVISVADLEIDRMEKDGILSKRLSVLGTPSWGKSNKLALHRQSRIPVDFFASTEATWYNYLVCRTGPLDLNIRIAAEAKRRGYQWHPYGAGFAHLQSGNIIPVHSEEDVFEFVGFPFMPPSDRV